MLILGIDDSGRGPVIGPMVISGVLIKEREESKLRELGVKDSKKLSSKRRNSLADKIKKYAIDFSILLITPTEIDERNSTGVNLNKLEAIKSAQIINDLVKDTKINEKIKIIIDCPSNNIEKWRSYLLKHLDEEIWKRIDKNIILICEHKADSKYIACSAASILAKVTRDNEINEIKKRLCVEFGSGYPSDPITKKFLEEYGKKHRKDGIFRETWSTWKRSILRKEQTTSVSYTHLTLPTKA